MCGAYHSHLPAMHFWADALKNWPSELDHSQEMYPSSNVAALRSNEVEAMRWGLVPSWSKEFGSKYPTHNARIETVTDKPSYRAPWNHNQRCLMPMAGYYEWTGVKGSKTKWYITDKDTDGLMVAGLWEAWGPNQQLSCTMITRPADEYMSAVHHRMLVYLTPNNADSWLNGEMTQQEAHKLELPNVIYFPDSQR